MTVIAMDTAPEGVRGELTRWFLELKPGVFVGKVNVRIRDLLWERICKTEAADGAVMVYSDTNEQGFSMRVYGDPKRSVVDLEGVQLIMVQHEKGKKGEEKELLSFPFEIEFLEELSGDLNFLVNVEV